MPDEDKSPATTERISACVLTFNEESKIERCLRSLTWCDELVIMDSFSTDGTLEICRRYTDRVYQHAWLGYVGQRNLVREMTVHPWILFLDADEEVSTGLIQEIKAELQAGKPHHYVGFEFPRQVYYLGRWIRHGEWYPDVKLRLFKKNNGRTEGEEPHDHVIVNGPVKRLRNPLYHYTYDDIRDHLDTLNRFSTITAQQKFVQESPFRWADLLLRPPIRFLKGYFVRLGFLDGMHGLIIAMLNSYGVFIKYAKLWEMNHKSRGRFDILPAVFPRAKTKTPDRTP